MTARSSTISPICGKTSLTSMPALPRFVNLNGDPYPTPFMLGISLPSIRVSAGFGSQVSTCDGAPWAKTWTTCLALAGNGGTLGSSVASASACAILDNRPSPNSAARLKAPKPMPARWRNWPCKIWTTVNPPPGLSFCCTVILPSPAGWPAPAPPKHSTPKRRRDAAKSCACNRRTNSANNAPLFAI